MRRRNFLAVAAALLSAPPLARLARWIPKRLGHVGGAESVLLGVEDGCCGTGALPLAYAIEAENGKWIESGMRLPDGREVCLRMHLAGCAPGRLRAETARAARYAIGRSRELSIREADAWAASVTSPDGVSWSVSGGAA
jgi:hypothetical protein